MALPYDEVPICKFVYDFDTDDYRIAIESWSGGTMYYYEKPYHSDLMEELAEDDYDVYEHQTVEAYLLLQQGRNALDGSELPAMTFACKSPPIRTIITVFQGEGLRPKYWYNSRTSELTDLIGNPVDLESRLAASDDYDEEEEEEEYCDYCGDTGHDEYNCPVKEEDEEREREEEEERNRVDYETVDSMKFVYDENHDEFNTGDYIQTYYDHPHHSELMEQLAETTGNWDMEGLHSGYLYLDHSPSNAMTYDEHPTFRGMVMTTIPPHEQIIKHFRGQGYPITHWYEKKPYPERGTVVHEIPQELPKQTTSKLAELGDFSLIKFVSLPDKFLIGENTHHAYLLAAEFGSNTFPSNTAAIGRAWIENGKIHGIGFDFGSPNAQRIAIEQLREWATDHGYDYSDNMEENIQGLASTSIIDQIKNVADSIKHNGDYGQCYWNPNDKKVFWNMSDSDGPPEYDSQDEIRDKFLAIDGVEDVEFGDESGPPGGWYQMASAPTAFVYSGGHMYYGVDHAQIIDDHDIMQDGLYGRLFERPEGGYLLELYSDYDPDQTKGELDKALEILSKRFNIAEIQHESLISPEDMADAEQYFA